MIVAAPVALCLEIAFRILDRQPLTRVALNPQAPSAAVRGRVAGASADLEHLARVPLAPGVDAAWYLEEPQPVPRIPVDRELAQRAETYPGDPYTPFFEFNRKYLERQMCGDGRGAAPRGLHDFFYFEPLDGQPYPTFRHLRHISPPSWFVTNNFGWRGSDVPLDRGADVVRLAFVGASTTVDSYSAPFSHPELIAHWLNRWASRRHLETRFEVINAGRTGIDSRSIAAIVRKELVPVDPDLVVFYEGGNQFTPGGTLRSPLRRVFPKPASTFRERTVLERRSALVRRVLSTWDRLRGGSGDEPGKPPAFLVWPAGVDESAPDPHDRRLPMDLPQVVADLDAMRGALAANGSELALSSFIWLAYPGMTLDPVRHANIYRYLNDTLWPIPYAHIRRMADFQNRVFTAYARQAGAPFIDIDRAFPRDADLFDDPVHLTYAGLRLQGWIYLQALIPMIDERLASGRWPRAHKPAPLTHPDFDRPDRRIVTTAELAAHCS